MFKKLSPCNRQLHPCNYELMRSIRCITYLEDRTIREETVIFPGIRFFECTPTRKDL